jgi:hypothetical protein
MHAYIVSLSGLTLIVGNLNCQIKQNSLDLTNVNQLI